MRTFDVEVELSENLAGYNLFCFDTDGTCVHQEFFRDRPDAVDHGVLFNNYAYPAEHLLMNYFLT